MFNYVYDVVKTLPFMMEIVWILYMYVLGRCVTLDLYRKCVEYELPN